MPRKNKTPVTSLYEHISERLTDFIPHASRRALEQSTVDAAMLGTSALHIGIDPAAPNGDHAAIAIRNIDGAMTTSTVAAGEAAHQGMTVESLMRARELLECNAPPYGRSPAADAIDAVRMMNQAREQQARRGERPGLVAIQFESRPELNQIQVTTRMAQLHNTVMIDPEELIPDNFRDMARNAAREFAHHLEREIMMALSRAHEDANRDRYSQSGWREVMRHMVDIAPGAVNAIRPDMVVRMMLGEDEPEKKGEFDWAKKFKYKSITHNGWTAKVLNTYEAVKEEGREMGHCLGGAYTAKIAKGEYLAVHITAPEGAKLPKSGFTLGFKRNGEKLKYDQLKGKKNDMHHCQHSGLLWFVNMVENVLAGKPALADALIN